MNNLDNYMDLFFSRAASVLEQENEFLEKLFSRGEQEFGFYKSWPQGISCLFETTLVYLIFRELLKTQFPLEVGWEDPYPNSSQKVDLALKQGREARAFIEFKIWKSNSAKDIEADLVKMAKLPESIGRFVFVIWWPKNKEESDEHLAWFQKERRLDIRLRGSHSFKTMVRSGRKLETRMATLALLEAGRHSV